MRPNSSRNPTVTPLACASVVPAGYAGRWPYTKAWGAKPGASHSHRDRPRCWGICTRRTGCRQGGHLRSASGRIQEPGWIPDLDRRIRAGCGRAGVRGTRTRGVSTQSPIRDHGRHPARREPCSGHPAEGCDIALARVQSLDRGYRPRLFRDDRVALLQVSGYRLPRRHSAVGQRRATRRSSGIGLSGAPWAAPEA